APASRRGARGPVRRCAVGSCDGSPERCPLTPATGFPIMTMYRRPASLGREKTMPYQVRTERELAPGVPGPIILLEESSGAAQAAIAPGYGFNCYHWQVQQPAGLLNLLYADPEHFASGRPTRSGIPILAPFPNRVRDGHFTWDGKEYELPRNDPTGKN